MKCTFCKSRITGCTLVKVKGVTLVETVVVLILTSLIAVFCVYAYLIIKKQEQFLWRNESQATQLSLAATKLSELSYKAHKVKWLYPKLTFESYAIDGEVKFEVDSVCILNGNGDVLIRVPLDSYSVDTLDLVTGGLLAKKVEVQFGKLQSPFVYEYHYGQDNAVNNSIDWKR